MSLIKKILVGTGIAALATGAIAYARRLGSTATELVIVPKAMIHKLNLNGALIRVDVKIKNPTRTKLKMKFPFVKLIYKENVIGSSQVVPKDILVPGFGEAVIDKIMIDIPLTGIFSLAGDLVKALLSGEGVKANVRTLTTIDLGWKKVPYEDNKEITLKK
ncbi:MAG: hypothetical protein IT233_12635 [Bacteroidia bacterium]|nr:hypothetical protein [Bacteroidia bacterium]